MKYLEWKTVPTRSTSVFPNTRSGHTLTYVPTLHSLLMFGGCNSIKNNQLYVYSLQKCTWSTREVLGMKPSPRCYHQAIYDKRLNALVIVGGYAESNVSMADIHLLFLTTWTWNVYKTSSIFPARHHHTLFCPDNQSYILFGGLRKPENQFLNDTWKIAVREIGEVNQNYMNVNCITIEQLKTKGNIPEERYGQVHFIHNDKLYLFGGILKSGAIDNSIYIFDWNLHQWSKIIKVNTPRHVTFGNIIKFGKKVVLFGGQSLQDESNCSDIRMLDLDLLHWSYPFVAGSKPKDRLYSAGCNIGGQSTMYLIGGVSRKYCSMEMYCLQEQKAKRAEGSWQRIQQTPKIKTLALESLKNQIVQGHIQISYLEHAIRQEKQKALEMEQKGSILKEKIVKVQKQCMDRRNFKFNHQHQLQQMNSELARQTQLVIQMTSLESELSENLEQSISLQQSFVESGLKYIHNLECWNNEKTNKDIEKDNQLYGIKDLKENLYANLDMLRLIYRAGDQFQL